MTVLVAMLQDLLELHNFDAQKTRIMFPAPPGLEIPLPGSILAFLCCCICLAFLHCKDSHHVSYSAKAPARFNFGFPTF